jgi:hypothetical protein
MHGKPDLVAGSRKKKAPARGIISAALYLTRHRVLKGD